MTRISITNLPGVVRQEAIIDDLRIPYVTSGKGEVILMIHGWIGSFIEFPTLFPFLSKHYQVIALDLPGFGEADPFPIGTPHTTENIAHFIIKFIDHLKLDRLHLVGNCFGGTIALSCALKQPEKIENVVVFTPVYKGEVMRKGLRRLARIVISPAGALLFDIVIHNPTLLKLVISMYLKHADGSYKRDSLRKKEQLTTRAAIESMRDLLYLDLSDKIQAITRPILVIIFERDAVLPPHALDELRRLIPEAKFQIVKNKGHFVDPDDMLPEYEKILSFLQNE